MRILSREEQSVVYFPDDCPLVIKYPVTLDTVRWWFVETGSVKMVQLCCHAVARGFDKRQALDVVRLAYDNLLEEAGLPVSYIEESPIVVIAPDEWAASRK